MSRLEQKRLRVHIIDRDAVMRLQIMNELGRLTADPPTTFLPSTHFEFWSAAGALPNIGSQFDQLIDVVIIDLELIPENMSITSVITRISQANMLEPLYFVMHGDAWYEFSKRSQFKELAIRYGCLRGNMDQLCRVLQQIARIHRK